MDIDISELLITATTTIAVFVVVIFYIRLNGLRSFSKMSSFDFAMTIATGSMMAAIALRSTNFLNGIIAMGVLFGTQYVFAYGRRKYHLSRIIDNKPIMLMENGILLQKNLNATNVTESDIAGKLREANVSKLTDVNAVILETTGDISVIHGADTIDDFIINDITRL